MAPTPVPLPSDLAARIVAEVDALRDELVAFLARIVRVASVNPKYPGEPPGAHDGRESEVARLVADVYAQAGADASLVAVEPGRENAVGVVRGAGAGSSLLLNGHIDVVPAGPRDRWTSGDPFAAAVDDAGRMWGRGTSDMKAGVAAQAFAALALRRAGVALRGDLLLEAVVGEEVGDHEAGTSGLIARGFRADAAVVAEPSAPPAPLAVVPVTTGLLWVVITVRGRATHSGLRGSTVHATAEGPALGVNAVDKGVLVLQALRALEDEWAETNRHPLYPPGHFSILPGRVVAGAGDAATPFFHADAMTIDCAVNYHPDRTPQDVEAELRERLRLVAAADPWLREHPPELEVKLAWPGSVVDPEHPICRATAAAHEQAAEGTRFAGPAAVQGFGGAADTTFLCRAGIPAIVYGPGDLRLAHAPDEHVALDELHVACRTFALLAAAWCGVADGS